MFAMLCTVVQNWKCDIEKKITVWHFSNLIAQINLVFFFYWTVFTALISNFPFVRFVILQFCKITISAFANSEMLWSIFNKHLTLIDKLMTLANLSCYANAAMTRDWHPSDWEKSRIRILDDWYKWWVSEFTFTENSRLKAIFSISCYLVSLQFQVMNSHSHLFHVISGTS